MKAPSPLRDEQLRRLAEASAWRVNLSAAKLHSSEEFEQWLAGDPANGEAWDKVQDGWAMFGDHASSPAILALRRGALGRAERAGRKRWVRENWLPRIAACLILLALAGGLTIMVWPADKGLVYATALGERRMVTLGDGSKISLDSSSEVRIRYSQDARRLELLSGQARFDVAHDAMRPFSVKARDRVVVATGTAFNIDLLGSQVQVTLIEGKVRVLDEDGGAEKGAEAPFRRPAIALKAGQQLTAVPAALERIETVNLERVTSWERGELTFFDEPLAEIAGRVSRYSQQSVRVDPAVGKLRLSGMFKAGDVPAFVTTVSEYLQVRATRQPDGTIILVPKG